MGFLSFALILVGCAGMATSNPSKTAAQGAIAVSPGTLDFKTVIVGQTFTGTMQITNTSSASVQISALAVSNKQFAISGPAVPHTIVAGGNLQYTIAFTPTAPGSASGSISISNDAMQAPLTIGLAGTGQKAVAALAVTPASVSFGNQSLNTTSTQNVTLQNTGDVNVSINGVTVVGAGFGYSSLSPGYSLSPNQKVTFQVWFKPQVKGAASGTLSVLAANLATPAVASLSGDGVSSTPSPTPPPPPPPTPTPTPTPTAHSVHLTWNGSTSSVVGYRLYRGDVSGGPYNAVNGSNIDGLSFDDSSVTSGTTYYYVVTAVNSAGEESVHSNEATAVIPTP